MVTPEQAHAALHEQVIRLDERQKAAADAMRETQQRVDLLITTLSQIQKEVIEMRASLDTKINRALWGWIIGGLGIGAAAITIWQGLP